MAVAAKSQDDVYIDSSSDSINMDEWQELSQSDYAKVIFCDLYHHSDSGSVGCKFQITDNVHEDPSDSICLIRVGYDCLDQYLVSKPLSETECQEDGKLLHCMFKNEELPDLEVGFYQFLYVNRDCEVCGASMPFEIKQSRPKREEPPEDDIVTEKAEDDFILVMHGMEKKIKVLEGLLEESRSKKLDLRSKMMDLIRTLNEKEEVIAHFDQEILIRTEQCHQKQTLLNKKEDKLQDVLIQLDFTKATHEKSLKENKEMYQKIAFLENINNNLSKELRRQRLLVQEKIDSLSLVTPEKRVLIEQLEDQKYMIKALEDSKTLALKEMNDLTASLSKRTKVLNQTKCELASCKGKLIDLTANYDLQTGQIKQLMDEISYLYKTLVEKEDVIKRKSSTIDSLEDDVRNMTVAEQQVILTKSEETQSEPSDFEEVEEGDLVDEAQKKTKELSALLEEILETLDFKDKNRTTEFFKIKIQLLAMVSNMMPGGKVNESRAAAKKSAKKTGSKLSTPTKAERERYLKFLNFTTISPPAHKVASPVRGTRFPVPRSKEFKGIQKIKFHKIVGKYANIDGVRKDDLCLINQLTEKICSKEHSIWTQPGLENIKFENSPSSSSACLSLADSGCGEADFGSNRLDYDPFPKFTMEDKMVILNRFINVMKKHIKLCNNLMDYVDNYHMEYGTFSVHREVDLILDDCKTTYQIEILTQEVQQLRGKCETVIYNVKAVSAGFVKQFGERDEKISKFKEEIAEKDTIIKELTDEKTSLGNETLVHQRSVNEHVERLVEAADIYKKQFLEIESLKRKLKKMKRFPQKASSSKRSSMESELSSESAYEHVDDSDLLMKLSPFGFGISDSDTGEHLVGNQATAQSDDATEKLIQPIQEESQQTSPATPENQTIKVIVTSPEKPSSDAIEDLIDIQASGNIDEGVSLPISETESSSSHSAEEIGAQDTVNAVSFASIQPFALFEEEFNIPCSVCGKVYAVTSQSPAALVDHIQREHQVNMCPICGVLFEKYVPKRYINYHIEDHFKN